MSLYKITISAVLTASVILFALDGNHSAILGFAVGLITSRILEE